MADGDAWDEYGGDSLLMRDEIERLRRENEQLRAFQIRIHRLSGEVLKRPHKSLDVYELNRAILDPASQEGP